MEKVLIKYLEDALDNYLDNLQLKFVNFIIKFSNIDENNSSKFIDHDLPSLEIDINNFNKQKITKIQFLTIIRKILGKSQHKIMFTVPIITDLDEFELYNIRSSVNISVSCYIDTGIATHLELIREFDTFENIEIRNYEHQDRWVLLRDGEEILFIAIGAEKDNYLFFHTDDASHIKTLSHLATDPWIRSKKI